MGESKGTELIPACIGTRLLVKHEEALEKETLALPRSPACGSGGGTGAQVLEAAEKKRPEMDIAD